MTITMNVEKGIYDAIVERAKDRDETPSSLCREWVRMHLTYIDRPEEPWKRKSGTVKVMENLK